MAEESEKSLKNESSLMITFANYFLLKYQLIKNGTFKSTFQKVEEIVFWVPQRVIGTVRDVRSSVESKVKDVVTWSESIGSVVEEAHNKNLKNFDLVLSNIEKRLESFLAPKNEEEKKKPFGGGLSVRGSFDRILDLGFRLNSGVTQYCVTKTKETWKWTSAWGEYLNPRNVVLRVRIIQGEIFQEEADSDNIEKLTKLELMVVSSGRFCFGITRNIRETFKGPKFERVNGTLRKVLAPLEKYEPVKYISNWLVKQEKVAVSS